MADIVDKATRSRMMAAVKSRDTGPELALRRALWANGIRGYRVHRSDVTGRPDIAWIGKRIAVFADGAFWHGHPSAFTPGKSGEFWDRKIQKNVERDQHVNATLVSEGWLVVRLWDFEIADNVQACVEAIRDAIETC